MNYDDNDHLFFHSHEALIPVRHRRMTLTCRNN